MKLWGTVFLAVVIPLLLFFPALSGAEEKRSEAALREFRVIRPLKDRAFIIGDEVTQEVWIALDRPYLLDEMQLRGGREKISERMERIVSATRTTEKGSTRYHLMVTYQFFGLIRETKTVTFTGFQLRVMRAGMSGNDTPVKTFVIQVEPFPVLFFPLFPAETTPEELYGALAPVVVNQSPAAKFFVMWVAAGALFLVIIGTTFVPIAIRYVRWRMHSPFGESRMRIQRAHDTEKIYAAFKAALTAYDSRVWFGAGLSGFLERHPEQKPYCAELEKFFVAFDDRFFRRQHDNAPPDMRAVKR